MRHSGRNGTMRHILFNTCDTHYRLPYYPYTYTMQMIYLQCTLIHNAFVIVLYNKYITMFMK